MESYFHFIPSMYGSRFSSYALLYSTKYTHHPIGPLQSGRCRIRTRVDGFEARQDIQATLIALILARCPPFLKKAEGLARLWRALSLASQQVAPPVVERQPCP